MLSRKVVFLGVKIEDVRNTQSTMLVVDKTHTIDLNKLKSHERCLEYGSQHGHMMVQDYPL